MVHTYPEKLKKFLKAEGYEIRNFSQAASISNKNRAKHKNEAFFSQVNESPNMAWLLGFIAADGTIRKDRNEIKIGLSKKDREILEKIKNVLDLETEVKDYITTQGYECSSLAWTCEQHKQDLARYSIVPNKTFVLKPPYDLKHEYWIDYIRGYFDGDGSVNFLSTNNSLRWQVCSATPEILTFILDTLENDYNIPRVSILSQPRKNHELYYIQYSTNATKKIYNILYTPDSLRLERKYQTFTNLLMK